MRKKLFSAGEFEKVSLETFMRDTQPFFGDEYAQEERYHNLKLPTRATSGSAGYDFKAPFAFALAPGKSIKLPTGIRAKIADGWWLACVPRSSLGFWYRVQLDNTIGVIDSDYYNADNEGHIFAKLTNDSKDGKKMIVHAGDAFMQGIFLPYGVTHSDAASGVRSGGIGSTSKPYVEVVSK